MRATSIQRILVLLAVFWFPAVGWCRGCLVQGTLVDTPTGSVAIEKLRPGDAVWAIEGASRVRAAVQGCYQTTTEEILTLHAGAHVLRLTPEHPVAVGAGIFQAAEFLKVGQSIEIWDGRTLSMAAIEGIERTRESLPAFNLLVLPGEDFLAAGVVVHNKGCFLPDTPVELADGQSKPIDQLRPGDRLLAFTPDGRIVKTAVERIITAEVDSYLNVWTEDRLLKVTPEHPFYIGQGTFQTIGTLHPGDSVYLLRDGALTPERIVRMQRVQEKVTVYNLETLDPNTFFAHGIAVHNKGCFPAGTAVLTPQGEMPIETVKAGEEVTAVDDSGHAVAARVLAVYKAEDFVWTVSTNAGVLHTTADHPLGLWNGAFAATDEIPIGTVLARFDHGHRVPARLNAAEPEARLSAVYTLTVDGPHTFVADGFIVHNKGGGGGFSGGGFGGGGYHSSSYGSHYGGSSSTQPWNTVDSIELGIFGLIFVGALIHSFLPWFQALGGGGASSGSDDGEELDYVYPRGRIDAKSTRTSRLAEYLSQTNPPADPMFAPEKIKEVAGSTFTLLQQCWQARAYEPMRPLLTPELFDQHRELLQQMVHQHEINRIENLRVLATDLVHLDYGTSASQCHVTVLITASARDYYVDDRNNAFRRGDKSPATFQEFWVFQRCGNAWLLADIEQSRESDVLSHENVVEGWTNAQLQAVYAGGSPKDAGAASGSENPSDSMVDPAVPPPAPSASPPQSPGISSLPNSRLAAALRLLADGDARWDPHALLTRARTIYVALVAARQAEEAQWIGDGCFTAELESQLKEQCRQRQAEQAKVEYRNFCIRKTDLISIHPDPDLPQPQCMVRMTAHAQIVKTAAGKVEAQDPYEKSFIEYLTLALFPDGWRLVEVKKDGGMAAG